MNDSRQISHDIMNALERLRIMHDLVKAQKYEMISKEEITVDLKETLEKLQKDFDTLLQ
jgi:carotenoid cleavage dioxygenase-like enzyme